MKSFLESARKKLVSLFDAAKIGHFFRGNNNKYFKLYQFSFSPLFGLKKAPN